MPLHTKKEFAAMCGMTTKKLATYALSDRRKVVYTDDYVDSSVEPNVSFLEKWRDKNQVKTPKKESLRLTRPLTFKEMSADLDEEEEEQEEIPGNTSLDAKKLRTQILKMEKEIEKLTLANSKAQSEVVPIGLMDALFLQERQSILVESKNACQDILSIFGKRRDLSAEEKADIRAEFTDRLNDMMKRSAQTTGKAIGAIVVEFSEKRGKGERK